MRILCFSEQVGLIDVLFNATDQLLRMPQCLPVEYDEDDLHLMCQQKLSDFGKSNIQSFVFWKTVYSGCDQWERDTLTFELRRQFQRLFIARMENFPLLMIAVHPRRPNGMNRRPRVLMQLSPQL